MPRRLLAIVGATATGKTRLAIEIARAFAGEIINADSRQVYRGMHIGTAKPSAEEQAAARHWLVDVVAPDEAFTLAMFLDLAHGALEDIWLRDTLPIVAGGTGQYVWSLLEGWRVPRVPPDRTLRRGLQELAAGEGAPAVADELRAVDPASAQSIHRNNVRRMIRAIEVTRATGRPFSEWQTREAPPFDATIIGLRLDRDGLYHRIDARVDAMIERGLADEVRRLIAAGYGCDLSSMQSMGYREICAHLRGEMTIDDAVAKMKTEHHRLARMQHTWFRADDARIRWLDAAAEDVIERAFAIASEAAPANA